MKGLDGSNIVLYVISNIVALLLLFTGWKMPRLSRLLYTLLFLWASITNWETALQSPGIYLGEADLTFFTVYERFITGWFSHHITETVGLIAACQLLIAVCLSLKGVVFNIGAVGAIIFLLAIAPFGVGSAFPCTLLLAIGLFILVTQYAHDFIWRGGITLRRHSTSRPH